jgi:16S rRNA (guanine527-N7)-methyltransferase
VSRAPRADADSFGPDDVARLTGVSRETLERVGVWLDALWAWRERLNLIGPAEADRLWRRHVLDSLQLLPEIRDGAPAGFSLADLGSGAGFPGGPIACALEPEGARVALVEKSPRKAEFLTAAATECGLGLVVLNQPLDAAPPQRFDVVTARALAPAPRLFAYAHAWLKPEGRGVFLKGRSAAGELTAARESWTFRAARRESLSSADADVIAISRLAPRGG